MVFFIASQMDYDTHQKEDALSLVLRKIQVKMWVCVRHHLMVSAPKIKFSNQKEREAPGNCILNLEIRIKGKESAWGNHGTVLKVNIPQKA